MFYAHSFYFLERATRIPKGPRSLRIEILLLLLPGNLNRYNFKIIAFQCLKLLVECFQLIVVHHNHDNVLLEWQLLQKR